MTDPEGLRASLSAAAERHFGSPVAVTDVERLQGGASRELWAFSAEVDGQRRELVLRRDPAGEEDPGAREQELEVLRAVYAAGVPVPEPLWLHDDRRGLAMERVDGEGIARRLLRDDRYARARAALPGQLAAAAAATHAVDPGAIPSLEAPDKPAALAAIEGLEGELDRLGEPQPALELGLRWLRRHLPEPTLPTLVHGDFRLGNVLAGEAGLTAVLDWELCHVGDPVEDLGWMCIRSWRFGCDQRPAAGLGSRDALLEAYRSAGGRQVTRDQLFFWEALGNVRWGVLCRMQADTHLSGRRSSLEHAMIGRRTCEPEWDLLAMIG